MTGKIITIAQQKGGTGKTTLAANLAVALLARGDSVAILDTDPQGSLGRWFMARIEERGEQDSPAFSTASAWGARYQARDLAKRHDYVIVDTPPKMGMDGRPAIDAADLVVMPVTPSQVDLWASEPTIEMAAGQRKQALAVLNRASERMRVTGTIRRLLDDLECELAATIIGQRVIYAETMGAGLSVLERRPSGPAAGEIAALADDILHRLASAE